MSINVPKEDYMGMDAATLQQKRLLLQSYKELYERNITDAKRKISELKKQIKNNESLIAEVNMSFERIDEALKHSNNVEYETIIVIRKKTVSQYKGTRPAAYYSPSDWQEKVVYYFELYKSNVLGMDKGCSIITKSRDYANDEKGLFNEHVLEAMLNNGVIKLYLDNGVKINTTMLKKKIPALIVNVKN